MHVSRFVGALLIGALLLQGASMAMAQSSPSPTVTTREEAGRTLREYRLNGQLYAIEIRPDDGPAYHLIDRDGKGNFVRQSGTDIPVPDWVRPAR